MSDLALIRKFRRSIVLATGSLFVLGLLATVILRSGANFWVTATWTAVVSPIVVGIAICLLLPVERMAVALGLSQGHFLPQLRPVVVFWVIAGIALPWIAAWTMADLTGHSLQSWWHQRGDAMSYPLLWSVRLAAGAATYSLASAIGLFLTYFFGLDRGPAEGV